MSNFHHQPGNFFRTDLLSHSTAADRLLQGGDENLTCKNILVSEFKLTL